MNGEPRDKERQLLSTSVNERATIARLEGAIAAVRERIAGACARAGRRPEEVRLVAVSKRVPRERVALGVRAGLRELGENYVQELLRKRAAAPEATWHFVGRLQRNKVRGVLEAADVVQTLEPGPAARRLAGLATERGRPVDGLIEVDFTGGRVGASPEGVAALIEDLAARGGVRVRGLMTVAPLGEDPRPFFARLRALRDRLGSKVEELSMGMSADLEAAVEEGATMVRVGTAIFGPRPGE